MGRKIPSKQINVIIVADQDLVRSGLSIMLRNVTGINVVTEMPNNADTLRLIRQASADIVLIDVKAPAVYGLETARSVLRFDSRLKVMLILGNEESSVFPHLLELNVCGYISRDSSAEDMVNAIYTVQNDKRYFAPSLTEQLVSKGIKSFGKSPFDKLSIRELQVALMLLSGKKTRDIAARLRLSPKTINTYRYRIHAKMGIKSDVKLASLALQYKLIG